MRITILRLEGINQRTKKSLWKFKTDSLAAEPQGKPKNIGVGSLSLLQGILPTQELNWRLLHCRWILYQLSYQGSTNVISKIKWLILELEYKVKEISQNT